MCFVNLSQSVLKLLIGNQLHIKGYCGTGLWLMSPKSKWVIDWSWPIPIPRFMNLGQSVHLLMIGNCIVYGPTYRRSDISKINTALYRRGGGVITVFKVTSKCLLHEHSRPGLFIWVVDRKLWLYLPFASFRFAVDGLKTIKHYFFCIIIN